MLTLENLNMNVFDDKYTILYKYVLKFNLPKRFFAIVNNKIVDIYEALNNTNTLDNLQDYFVSKDLLMIRFEQTLDQKQLIAFKKWYLNRGKKDYKRFIEGIANDDVQEYSVNTIVDAYYDTYKDKANKKVLADYFKAELILYYYDEDAANKILRIFNRSKKTTILNEFFTQEDYEQVSYESSIKPSKQGIKDIIAFCNQFEDLKYIRYDRASFIVDYLQWIVQVNDQFLKDAIVAKNVVKQQQYGNKYQSLMVSPRTLDKLVKIYKPTMNGKNIDVYDGMYLFNESVVSVDVPYVIYKNDDKIYYKVYQNNEHKDNLLINKDTIENNTINFYINNGNAKLYDVKYYLAKKKIHITFYQFDTVNIGEIIENVIPIQIDTNNNNNDVVGDDNGIGDEYTMDGYINVWSYEMNEGILADFILNGDMNNVFFVDDNKSLVKKSMSINYVPFMSGKTITLEVIQAYYENDKIVKYINNGSEKDIKLETNKKHTAPYLHIKFSDVYHYDGFVDMIKVLLFKVHNQFQQDNKLYGFCRKLNTLLNNAKGYAIDANLKLLKEAAPDAFVEGYANFCDKRPRPINEDEKKDYIKNKIKDLDLRGVQEKNFKKFGVMDFPVRDQVVHLVCDYDEHIYPYQKSTKTETKMNKLDKNVYSALPCCKKNPPKAEKTVKIETSHVIKNGIIGIPGAFGQLDDKINYVLSKYNNDKNNKLLRMGIINDKNSFVHCMCVGVDDAGYVNTKKKSSYVEKLIDTIGDEIHFGLLKQENYDLVLTTIKNNFLNNNYMDPDLYYRAFEEYFDVNVYVFSPDAIMDIPRYKVFHTRPVRKDRRTLLIYKHKNGHCELIVNKYSDTNKVIIFDEDMTVYCHHFLQNIMNVLTFSIVDKNVYTYSNLYYHINTLGFLSDKNTQATQYIDVNGKLRGLTLGVGVDGETKMTILTFPSQPENLSISNKIETAALNDVLKVFTQKPSGIYRRSGYVFGVWYQLFDMEFGVYVPVKREKVGINDYVMDVKDGPRNYMINKETSANSYLKLRKLLNIVTQVFVWLYFVANYQFDDVSLIDNFLNKYVIIQEEYSNIYDGIVNMPYRLPMFDTFEEYINYIGDYCPEMVLDGKVILQKGLYQQMMRSIQMYSFVNESIPFIIKGYYTYVSDFKVQETTLIFMDYNALDAWLHNNTIVVNKNILPVNKYPYLFQDVNGSIYIIQNTRNNTLNEAIALIAKWNNEKVNLPGDGKKTDISPSIYKPILLSKYNKNISHLELVVRGSVQYKVLDYKYIKDVTGIYAAMLPLF